MLPLLMLRVCTSPSLPFTSFSIFLSLLRSFCLLLSSYLRIKASIVILCRRSKTNLQCCNEHSNNRQTLFLPYLYYWFQLSLRTCSSHVVRFQLSLSYTSLCPAFLTTLNRSSFTSFLCLTSSNRILAVFGIVFSLQFPRSTVVVIFIALLALSQVQIGQAQCTKQVC